MKKIKQKSGFVNVKVLSGQIFLITAFLSVFFSVTGCERLSESGTDAYYITGPKENKAYFQELFTLLEMEEEGGEGEFAVVREIAASFARTGDYDRLTNFLSARIINNSEDPYNSYYLLMIAYAHLQLGSEKIADMYFEMIIKNYPDLVINDESIHLICLRRLIDSDRNPERQVWYYQELISRFSDKIDLGTAYFMLGQSCEGIGDWNNAIQAYTNYLPYTGTIIPGFPNADQYAKQQVDFSRSPKDWTFESLPALRQAVEEAIDSGDARALTRCQAKINFFARSWEQVETDDSGIADFNLAEFIYSNRIRYEASLDASSNATEAYLRTTGWYSYLSTWYLYFRKIYFPQDPEIHGRWEWAGVYYGEKF